MFDMKNLQKIGSLKETAPDAMAGFAALDQAAMNDGVVPKKYKELMALAVALTTQCGIAWKCTARPRLPPVLLQKNWLRRYL